MKMLESVITIAVWLVRGDEKVQRSKTGLYGRMVRQGLVARTDSDPDVAGEAGLLLGCPVVSLDEATRYFYEVSGREDWHAGEDLPVITPPFYRAFLQTRRPFAVRDASGKRAEPSTSLPEEWGALVLAEDLSKTHSSDGGDWRAAAKANLAAVVGFYGTGGRLLEALEGGRVEDFRWLVSMSFYARFGNPDGGSVRGPLARAYLAVTEDGQLARARLPHATAARRDGPGGAAEGEGSDEGQDVALRIFASPRAVHLGPAGRLDGPAAGLLAHTLANPLLFGMSLMHCKNVGVEEVEVRGQKARKVRASAGGAEDESRYHVLNVEPMKRVLEQQGRLGQVGVKRALTLVRGHFKHYTPENPLFGKHVGRYWFPPHLRGDKSRGAVSKDYRVAAPARRPAWVHEEQPAAADDEASVVGTGPQDAGAVSSGKDDPEGGLLGRILRWARRRRG